MIHRVSSKCSLHSDYKSIVLQQDAAPLLDAFVQEFDSQEEFEMRLKQLLHLWELQKATVSYYSSLIHMCVGSISTRELYLLLWNGTMSTSDVHKRLRHNLLQIQDSEQFRKNVLSLEELVLVGI